jgi:hypothetical protein
MFTILSLVTSVKDYIEIVHKLVETNPSNNFGVDNYYDFGAILTYLVLSGKELLGSILTFKWLQNIASLPLIIPDVASSMLSEISVLDGSIHNSFRFLETPISYGNQNALFYGIEKFGIGLVNSIFLCIPTSTAHIITLRRFVMQGLEAGYLAGLGTLAGNLIWIGSIVFGLRFIVIPWISLDILRYVLGFLLLVKYMWDSYHERRTVLEDLSKWKIFLLNFLLAFTEQATIYPFLSNLSIGSDATILESFPTGSFMEYTGIHFFYMLGLFVGSLSLLQFTCWFWENPAFNIYMWAMSSLKMTTPFSQKFLNLGFLYLTMLFAVSNLSYFGLDYTLAKPLGLVHEDRLIDQKTLLETSFLNTKASDRNTRRNRGRHGRRERWKRRVRRYRTFDASLYDQGVYDLFTIEDLNYGFDRFWLRRKIRNHRVRFRFFPGPWMRSFKKQLARPRLESFMGPRVEFFRILFEQAYHPEFHEFRNSKKSENSSGKNAVKTDAFWMLKNGRTNNLVSFYSEKNARQLSENLMKENSALRKFVRKLNTRTNSAQILWDIQNKNNLKTSSTGTFEKTSTKPIYSKRWKQIFSKISHRIDNSNQTKGLQDKVLQKFYKTTLGGSQNTGATRYFPNFSSSGNQALSTNFLTSKQNSEKLLSKKDRQILRYRTFLMESSNNSSRLSQNSKTEFYKPLTLVHPIKFYLQKDQAFRKKMKFYGATLFRNFGIENNAPYYRIMMKKFFYYYKPTLRWERTMRTATMRKARRKGPRIPRKLNVSKQTQMLAKDDLLSSQSTTMNFFGAPLSQSSNSGTLSSSGISASNDEKLNDDFALSQSKTSLQRPTHFYSLVSKRATRYRYQIYKDVLQHWYYSPFNRLLLKFDVDSFIRRQPMAHFLTKKEENLLHLKRFLLSDYYNSLRWYSYMQHYNSMKSTIGKTKSFATRSYNQQFFGTFKKIRHLFAITPSFNDNNVLKFDQPLFNEYSSNLSKQTSRNNLYTSSVIHEELLADDQIYRNQQSVENFPEDLQNQSTKIVKQYLQNATPVRRDYIEQLLKENNYSELTKFIFKGQKTRGNAPITNETSFLEQENESLKLVDEKAIEKENLHKFFEQKILNESFLPNSNALSKSGDGMLTDSRYLWISLMKKCRNMLYNQEALKLYLSARVDKLEKQKRREEKVFQTRLDNMKNWVALPSTSKGEGRSQLELSGLTTSLQKSIKEGMYYQLSGQFSGKNLEKTNLRNNREKILESLPWISDNSRGASRFVDGHVKPNISINLKNHLNNRIRLKAIQTFEAEKNFRKTLASLQTMKNQDNNDLILTKINPGLLQNVIQRTLIPFKWVSKSISSKVPVEQILSESFVKKPTRWITEIFRSKENKNLEDWKKREVVFSTRKKIRRKIYRVLDQKRQIEKASNVDELEKFRQKRDTFDTLDSQRREKSWKNYEKEETASKSLFSQIFEKNFKRKRTRSRRYRRFKGRGPIKKHTLAEKLKRQFKLLKRYGGKTDGQDKKVEILEMITKRKYTPNSAFEPRETKQRRTRQSKHRYWKKHKRQKYLQVKRQQRKRRRYAISKLRVLNKELKRLKSQVELKNWWWKTFLPSFRATTDTYWQNEKNNQIQEELQKLSISDILERDQMTGKNSSPYAMLQIGDQDFKPLGVPEALSVREDLVKNGQLNFGVKAQIDGSNNTPNLKSSLYGSDSKNANETNLVGDLSKNILSPENLNPKSLTKIHEDKTKVWAVNPMPFYAGWDENLRQFVVTNRLLSRKDAGYAMKNSTNTSRVEFTKAPLQGMNAATTLYWQIPFTTYDPDQFFALGMDGFSPLGWRFFNFKHSKQTTKPLMVQNVFTTNQNKIKNTSLLSYNVQLKMLDSESLWSQSKTFNALNRSDVSKNQNRKIQKRQKRVKKHPRPPVWFPSGPLSNQILPVHYIYVFYKRNRLPRDRYIGRRLRRSDDRQASFFKANFTKFVDFTLRKRVKPIRKYHRKRGNKSQDTSLMIRRRPFKELSQAEVRFRPISKTPLLTQMDFLNSSLLKTKQRKKTLTTKPNAENLRLRQLRRRIQRQVLRPIMRYKPRSGGLIWPGDYFRLESVKAPNLSPAVSAKSVNDGKTVTETSAQVRKKKRRNIQEWQIQPKKYLLEKHNLKVLKKRLQKSQNFTTLAQQIGSFR